MAPTLAGLRDLSLLSADTTQVSSFAVRHGDDRTELSKQSGVWQLVAPDPAPEGFELDPARVDGRLSALTRTQGTRFLGVEGEVDADFSDSLDLELQLADGSTRRISFGGPVGEADNPGVEEVAVRPGNGFVYAIRAFERTRYDKPLALFERVEPAQPPPGMGGMQGLESLPPDVRRQIEAQLRQQGAR